MAGAPFEASSALTLGETAKRLVEQRRIQAAKLTSVSVGIDPKIADARLEQLRDAFSMIDKDGSGTISLEEVMTFLKGVNPELNPAYIAEIYNSLDTNHDGHVTITEFTTGYLSQVNQISEALADLRHSISLTKEAISNSERHLADTQLVSQGQNEYGVPIGSRLKITVREAQSLPKGLFSLKSYAELTFDRQTIRTNLKDGSEPKWEERFEFLAERPDGRLLCKIMRKDAISSDDLVGECEVTMEELRDQQARDVWKQLAVGGKAVGSARVLLAVQLVFDDAKRLRGEIEKMQRTVDEDQELETRLQEQLLSLGTSPMGMFSSTSFSIRLEQRMLSTISSVSTSHLEVTPPHSVVVPSSPGVCPSSPFSFFSPSCFPPSVPVLSTAQSSQ